MHKKLFLTFLISCLFLISMEVTLSAKSKDRERRKIEEARAKKAEAEAEEARAKADAANARKELERIRADRDKEKKKQKEADADWNGIMFKAIRNGNVDQFKLAIQSGADIESKQGSHYGDTVLHTAVRANKPDFVRLLLKEYKIDPNILNFQMTSPLHLAVIAGYDDIVKILLANKANKERLSKGGFTPFQLAVHYGNVTTAKILQGSGCIIPKNIEKLARTPEMMEYVKTLPKQEPPEKKK